MPRAYGPWERFTYQSSVSPRADGATEVESLSVIVMGQTGYGKSSLLNALLGAEAFESDAVRACTRSPQSAEVLLSEPSQGVNRSLSLLDLPGIAESSHADAETRAMYEQCLNFASVILFVLRADKRDHERDLALYHKFIKPSGVPVVIAINACDKVEPLNRKSRGLSEAQRENLERKVRSLSELLKLSRDDFSCVSAVEGWGVSALFERLLSVMRGA